jgi:BMFP domain-containing protein YqiC
MFRQHFENFVASLKLVTREEFEVVEALAMKARDEQETLSARLTTLEAELAALKAAGQPHSTSESHGV